MLFLNINLITFYQKMKLQFLSMTSEDFKEYCKFYNLKETILELVFYLSCKYSSGKHVSLIDNRVVWKDFSPKKMKMS